MGQPRALFCGVRAHDAADSDRFRARAAAGQARLWLSARYESDGTGSPQVYVETFPAGEGKWQIPSEGGTRPLWSRDGNELFYVSTGGKIMTVEVRGGPGFAHREPKPLFDVRMSKLLLHQTASA